LAIDLNLEAAEVLEHVLWKTPAELETFLPKKRGEIGEELSDVLHAAFLLAHDLGIDLGDAFKRKMKKNAVKYPVHKAKGSAKKYTEL
ncbi:MAG: MazG-like family protein, partial [Tepidisphaeraceae bacterium]